MASLNNALKNIQTYPCHTKGLEIRCWERNKDNFTKQFSKIITQQLDIFYISTKMPFFLKALHPLTHISWCHQNRILILGLKTLFSFPQLRVTLRRIFHNSGVLNTLIVRILIFKIWSQPWPITTAIFIRLYLSIFLRRITLHPYCLSYFCQI